MPIDYDRLVDGLSATTEMVNDGRAGLAAIDSLVATAREATRRGGRDVHRVRRRGRAGRRGQRRDGLGPGPAASRPEFVDRDPAAQPWVSPVDQLPAQVAEPLLARGVVAIAGHPVRTARGGCSARSTCSSPSATRRRWPSWSGDAPRGRVDRPRLRRRARARRRAAVALPLGRG